MTYDRAKFFWGAIDIIHSDESPYSQAQTHPLGENGLPPGIGVRRAQLVFTRDTLAPPQDACTTHLDFLNLTNGSPDDTWTDGDFQILEAQIEAFINATAGLMHTSVHFSELRWYRVGPGVLPPNPAIRIKQEAIAGTATNSLPPQVAASITLKTVPRRQWGRMYMPWYGVTTLTGNGRFNSGTITGAADFFNALMLAAIDNEMPPVIYSKVRGKAFTVETVQIDDVPDVIRSRRFNEATVKVIRP